ncbi:MAG: glucokinase [Gillisia sp.]
MSKVGYTSIPIIHKGQIPLNCLNISEIPEKGIILAADIGGTKTSLALFQIRDKKLLLLHEELFSTKEHTSFVEMLHQFQKKDLPPLDGISLGVAGPVIQGKVQGTNFPWAIDSEEIRKELKTESVWMINDMEANAYGLAALHEKDFLTLKTGENIAGNVALISPGTGLGQAGMFWDGNFYHPFATEGGHCDFSPRNDLDIEIFKFFQSKYGHVSWERLISGPGISTIYLLMRSLKKEKEPLWLKKKIEGENPSKVITATALAKKDMICVETLNLFIRFLAIESANLALKYKAMGGIFIGGGILPHIIHDMDKEIFRRNFVQSGRMNPLLQKIPVKVILNEKTALLGAALYGVYKLGTEH